MTSICISVQFLHTLFRGKEGGFSSFHRASLRSDGGFGSVVKRGNATAQAFPRGPPQPVRRGKGLRRVLADMAARRCGWKRERPVPVARGGAFGYKPAPCAFAAITRARRPEPAAPSLRWAISTACIWAIEEHGCISGPVQRKNTGIVPQAPARSAGFPYGIERRFFVQRAGGRRLRRSDAHILARGSRWRAPAERSPRTCRRRTRIRKTPDWRRARNPTIMRP